LNQNNYKFSKIDEKKIITWINENLMVNWVSIEENLAGIEILLLQMHSPLLNIARIQVHWKKLDNREKIVRI